VSEDEVMMPHVFERLRIIEQVPQITVVRHLNDRGFQVRVSVQPHGCLPLRTNKIEAHNSTVGLSSLEFIGWHGLTRHEYSCLGPFAGRAQQT